MNRVRILTKKLQNTKNSNKLKNIITEVKNISGGINNPRLCDTQELIV